MCVCVLRFVKKKIFTECSKIHNKIFPLTNLNKCIYNDTSEREVNINNISKIFLQNTAIIGELITAECASVLMFIFRVHRGQVGPDLSGQVLGCEGQ